METEIMLTGVGGQGVQLGGQILARAATYEGREVMTLGTYGGTMRGGSTDSSIVVADQPILSPPIVSRLAAALAMHPQFWAPIEAKLRPGAVVVLNSSVFDAELARREMRVFEVPATQLAGQLGNPLGGSLVLVAAYANLTGLVKLDSLLEAMRQSVPPYRVQHIEANERSLRAGFEALPSNVAPAWDDLGASV